jgi:hypothetical protein
MTIVIAVLLVIGAIAALIPVAASLMERDAHDPNWRDR